MRTKSKTLLPANKQPLDSSYPYLETKKTGLIFDEKLDHLPIRAPKSYKMLSFLVTSTDTFNEAQENYPFGNPRSRVLHERRGYFQKTTNFNYISG